MGNNASAKDKAPPAVEAVGKEWDKWANDWDKMGPVGSFNREFLARVKEIYTLDRSSTECLEVGSGTGLLTLPLSGCCSRVDSCDVSAEMIKVLDQKLKDENVTNVNTWAGDITSDETNLMGPYDLLLSGSVLTFCPDMPATLESMSKRLKPGGKMIHMLFKSKKRAPEGTKYFPDGVHPEQLKEITNKIKGLKVDYVGDGVSIKAFWWFPFFKMNWQVLVATKE